MSLDNSRLLLQLDKALRDSNRDLINSEFPKLAIADLKPVLGLVARSRADYLKELFDIAEESRETLPSLERIEELKRHRVRFEELIGASQALETAIERGYLDVSLAPETDSA